MKKIVLLLITTLFSLSARASFIAGGNITMSHISGYNYSIELDLYFDVVNGDGDSALLAGDLTIEVAIYEKGTNSLMQLVTLQRISDSLIAYQDSSCTINQLSTRLLRYVVDNNSQTVELNPATYNSPNGYYIVWERCCRDAAAVNIENADFTGMAFYMEFPAADTSFIDSSPKPITYENGYAIVGTTYSLNLACTDADGDSLVYSMTTPFAGHATDNGAGIGAEPTPPLPAPYPLVIWVTGYSATNAVPGTPPLSVVDSTGILSVTPNTQGLFAFAVLCEEFRSGIKIGEIREELFLLVMAQDSIVCQTPTTATGITTASSLDVILYPNPTSGMVNLSSNTTSDFTYEVFNNVGATISSGTANSFSTSTIKPGIYFVKISSGQQSSIQKLIVE